MQKSLFRILLLIGILVVGLFAFNTQTDYRSKAASQRASLTTSSISVGAIYWHCCVSTKRNEVEMLLSFDKWKDRQPYFTIDRKGGNVDIHEASQQVVDQEIQLAADAGLDYWAIFGRPGNVDGYTYGLDMYLKSPNKNKLKFALMLWTDPDAKDVEKFNEVINDPQYLRAGPDSRPVIFIWIPESADFKTPQVTFQKLIFLTQQKTGKAPILVATSSGMTPAALKKWGFTDLSWYAIGSEANGESYAKLANRTKNTWNSSINDYLNVIPTAMTGWDPRPKALNPLYHGYGTDPTWTQQGTPDQIAHHIKSAIDFIHAHPTNTSSKTVLIYAWNELAEGGWLMPTKVGNDQNQRLNAISKILGGKISGVPVSPNTENIPLPHPTGIVQITRPKNGDKIPANQPFHVTGVGPVAIRLTLKIGTNHLFFINGTYEYVDNNSTQFDITIPGLPVGTYALSATGPDTKNVTVTNIIVEDRSVVTPTSRTLTNVSVSGNTITASFISNKLNRDWIGLYLLGADNRTYIDWKWLNNKQGSAPTVPPATGTINFTNVKPGTYEVRYIIQDTGHVGKFTQGIKITVN